METKLAARSLPSIGLAVFAVLCAMAVFHVNVVAAENAPSQGALDGMVFAGVIGDKGSPDIADQLHFKDGRFWSSFCAGMGLPPGEYQTLRVGDAVEFSGVLTGAPGRFAYEGRIIDGSAQVSVNWIKKRWYWTTERELEFVGRETISGDRK